MRIAVLASHGGSTLQAVIDATERGELAAEVAVVISNNSGSGALVRARQHGVPTRHLSSVTHPDPGDLDTSLADALAAADVDWVLLAGYMKKLGPKTLSRYRNRILNTHPALLPKFGGRGLYGRRVHAAVLGAGDTESGATVHLVTEQYDTGPVLKQTRVPVKPGDTPETLEERVKTAERVLVVETLRELAASREASNY